MLGSARRALARRVYYGWVIAVACFLASVIVFGTSFAFGVLYDVFIDAFARSESLIAFVFGLQTALLYVSGVGFSRLIDRHGQRRVTVLSGVILVAGLAWTSVAGSYLELVASFGVVAAVGMAGLYIVSFATLPAWFERRRGTATGFASAGLGVGLVVVPPGVDAVIARFGWRPAVVALAGFVGLLLLVVVALFADTPEDVGADTGVEFRDTGDGAAPDPVERPRRLVTSGPFLLVFGGWVLIFAPTFVVFAHLVRYATDAGIGRSAGVLAIALIGVTTTVGRIAVGPVSDWVGRVRTFAVSGAALGLSTAAMVLAPSGAVLLAAACLFGVAYAGSGGLVGAVAADLFGYRSINTVFAVLAISFGVGGLVSPPLAGWWFETTGSYDLAFVGFGALGVLGAGAVALGTGLRDA